MKKLLSLLVALFVTTALWAYDFQSGDLYYNITSSTASYTAEVTYQQEWPADNYKELTSALIPATITNNGKTYSVTSIGEWSFYECTGLTSVTIPESVTSIGEWAFCECTGLTSVTIPESVTSIGSGAFSGCTGLIAITIPNNVTSIGGWAFGRCAGLTSVTIPNSVISIGRQAFENCTGLTSVTIPESVTSIGDNAFSGCTGLTSVTIPESVTSIGDNAFSGCTGLTSITIPNSVTSIGEGTFEGCTGFTSVTIPESVTSIGDNAFSGCTGLTSITIPESVTSIGWGAFSGCTGLTSITIPNSVTSIEGSAFEDCTGLTSVTIPNSVTSVGVYAFEDCTGLTSVTIGSSVTSIGGYAFEDCTGLTSITIPNSVTSIGNYAFLNVLNIVYNGTATGSPWGAKSMNGYVEGYFVYADATKTTLLACSSAATGAITIPNSVTSIESSAFSGCTGLTAVVWNAKDCSSWSSSSNAPFIAVSENITSFTFGDEVERIPAYLCYGMNNITSVTIPNSVTSIGKRAFYECTGLTSIIIPNSVTSIGESAFSGCTDLTAVVWNAKDCSGWSSSSYAPFIAVSENITSFTFGDEVESIPVGLCYGMNNITSITIPNSVTSISSSAFSYCTGLTSIVVESGNTVYDSRENCNAIIETATNTLIQGCNVTIIPTSITSIGSSAFPGCTGLTSITIPNGVTSIGYDAFNGCMGLTSVTIPNSVTSIGDDAFSGCTGLTAVVWNAKDCSNWSLYWNAPFYAVRKNITSFTFGDEVKRIPVGLCYGMNNITTVTIGNRVTSIEKSAFEDCTGLTSVTIPNSVTSIGSSAFSGCTGLTSITIPNSVTSIGQEAFEGCTSLTSITIPNNVTSIGQEAFEGCTSLTSITIPNSVTSIEGWAFYNCTGLTSVTIGNSVKSIGNYTFYNCTRLTSVTIPNSVTSIGESAFKDCKNLQEFTFPADMTSMGKFVLDGCTSLTSVVWNVKDIADYSSNNTPFYSSSNNFDLRSQITSFTFGDKVERIPTYLCYGMSNITSVTIPNSVTSIGESAFSDCTGLTAVVWNAKDCSSWSSSSYAPFYSVRDKITSFTFGDEVERIPVGLCSGMSKVTSITIPNSVTSIGSSAFSDCTGLTAVVWNAKDCSGWSSSSDAPFYTVRDKITSFTFGDEVERIPVGLCYGMSNITSITIPNGVTAIGDDAFYGCEELLTMLIPNSVTTIGDRVFQGCKNMETISFGVGLTSMGDYALDGCQSIYEMTCYATKVPPVGSNTFSEVSTRADLYVPSVSVKKYKTHAYWGVFNVLPIAAETVSSGGSVVVRPGETDVVITWPADDNADTYSLKITKDGQVFCTLVFNADGQLTNIAFAPARNGEQRSRSAVLTQSGYRFTVTGLNSGTNYAYDISVKDYDENIVQSYTGTFTTKGGTPTGMENGTADSVGDTAPRKVFRDGQVLILRGGKTYRTTGVEVK